MDDKFHIDFIVRLASPLYYFVVVLLAHEYLTEKLNITPRVCSLIRGNGVLREGLRCKRSRVLFFYSRRS